MRLWSSQHGFRIAIVVVLAITALGTFEPVGVDAANQLNSTLVRLSNMQTATATTGSVCVVPHSSGSMDYVQVTFPTGFVVSTTAANWTTSITAPSSPGTGSNYWPTDSTGPAVGFPNALSATPTIAGQTVTWQFTTAVALNTTGVYNCFDWTTAAALTTGPVAASTTGVVDLEDATPTVIDTGSYAVSVLSAANNNQIVVSATVPPIFQFSLTGNTDSLGNLSISAATDSTGVTATVLTNAKGGWYMWVESANQKLVSATTGGSIGSVGWNTDAPTTFTNGTSQYGLAVTTVNGGTLLCSASNLSASPEYNTGAATNEGGALTVNFSEIGQCTGAPSNGDGLKLVEVAGVSPITPAATDYTDTLTVTGAGAF
jgi:hypothetical protein